LTFWKKNVMGKWKSKSLEVSSPVELLGNWGRR